MRCITHFEFFIFLVWVLVGGERVARAGDGYEGTKKEWDWVHGIKLRKKKSIKTFKNKTTTTNILTTDHVDKHCFLIIAKCQRVINLE